MDENPYQPPSIPTDQGTTQTQGQLQVDWVGLVLLALVGAFGSFVIGMVLWVLSALWP